MSSAPSMWFRGSVVRRSALGPLVAMFVVLASPEIARGQSQPPLDARALVQDGVRLRREGRDAEALSRFQQAFAADARPSTRAQIGFALQALGRWVEAERELASLAAVEDPWVLRQRAVIDEALATVRSHLGSLELVCEPAGAEILVDGRSIGASPLAEPVRLAAGNVTVTVRLDGYYSIERAFVVRAGDRARETIELRRREPEPTQRSTVPTVVAAPTASVSNAGERTTRAHGSLERDAARVLPDDRPQRTWLAPVIATSVGAASLGVGAALIFVRNAAIADIAAAGCVETASSFDCPQPGSDVARATRAQSSAQAASTASAALMIAGGALAVSGAVWLVIDRTRASTTRAHVRWRGLSIEGRF